MDELLKETKTKSTIMRRFNIYLCRSFVQRDLEKTFGDKSSNRALPGAIERKNETHRKYRTEIN